MIVFLGFIMVLIDQHRSCDCVPVINETVSNNTADCLIPPYGYDCLCYNYYHQSGLYKCYSNTSFTLPSSVPYDTAALVVENPALTHVEADYYYLKTINYLILANNSISFMAILYNLNDYNLLGLNLAGNNFTRLPLNLKNTNITQRLWLGGNPYHCDCEMTWMIGWLNKTKANIEDYKNMTCHSGMMIGKPIYKLSAVEMGCFPNKWPTWQKVGIGAGIVLVVAVIVVLKINSIRKRNKKEGKLKNIEYDAFFCYSTKDFQWVRENFWKNKRRKSRRFDLEKDFGYKLLIHNRDWLAGKTIRQNIVESIEKSRRVIFILSRNFLQSKWGMEEFMMAKAKVEKGRKNFIIIVLKDDLDIENLTPELSNYLKTYTYINASENIDQLQENVRLSLPKRPLREFKPELFENEYETASEDEFTDTEDTTSFEEDADFDLEELDSDDEIPVRGVDQEVCQVVIHALDRVLSDGVENDDAHDEDDDQLDDHHDFQDREHDDLPLITDSA